MSGMFGAGVHPDIPTWLVHFTGRPRGPNDPPPYWADTTPEGRLANIGLTGGMYAKSVFGTRGPVLCFSECSAAALHTMFSTGIVAHRGAWAPWAPWAPWAIMFDRERLIAAGARPVLLMDDGEFAATNDLRIPLADRRQKYVPGRIDFTAEREWRLSMWAPDLPPGLYPWWPILPAATSIIVGQSGWLPRPDSVQPHPERPAQARFAAAFNGLSRWSWNGTALVADGVCDINTQMSWSPPPAF